MKKAIKVMCRKLRAQKKPGPTTTPFASWRAAMGGRLATSGAQAGRQ